MQGRHRRLSALRSATRTGSLLGVTAATGLGVILAAGASQAATILPAHPAAASHTTTWRHLAHLAHLARQRHNPAHLTAAYRGSVSGAVGSGGSFQSCVITRESGGNSQVMNATSHYGLYQFAYGTWVAYGGSPASFGHASVAEQNQVFGNAVAAGGQSNWAPYDGC